jgi:hypothetical protein
LDGNKNPVADLGINGLNSSDVIIHGNQISNVQEGILVQDIADFSGGVFAPPWSIGNTNVIVNATQQGLDFEVAATDTQSFNIVGTTGGHDLLIGGAGDDTFTYNVDFAHNGTQTSIGGGGTDTEIVNGTTTATTFNINAINNGGTTELGIHVESGTAPGNAVLATLANSQVTTSEIEEIVLNLSNAGDKVIVNGDLSGTGVATHTITINGGTGNDTVDLSQQKSDEDVVFTGGGGTDTVDLGFALAASTLTPIFGANHTLTGVAVSHTAADGATVTDTFTNVQSFAFSDKTVSLNGPNGLFTPTLQVTDASGAEDRAIPLSISAALSAIADPNAAISLTISGIPADATLSNTAQGTLTVTPGATTGSITFDATQLANHVLDGLTITPKAADEPSFALHVTATAADGTATLGSASHDLNVTVLPPITLQAVHATGTDDAVFDLVPTVNDPGATLESVAIIGIPVNINTNTTPFEFIDSNGTVIPIDNFGLVKGSGTNDNVGSVTLFGTELQTVLAGGLQLVELGGNGQPVSLDGLTFPLTLNVTASDNDSPNDNGASLQLSSTFVLQNNTAIADAPVLATKNATGTATLPISLPVTALIEADPDQTVTITVSGVPTGVTLNHGTPVTDPITGLTTYSNISPSDLATLTVTSDGTTTADQHFDLTFNATASEGTTTATATPATLHVDIVVATEAAPALSATAAAANVNEDGTVALQIIAAPADDAVVTVSGLTDANGNIIATLNHGTPSIDGGTVTLQQADLAGLTLHAADGDEPAIDLTVTATTPTSGTAGAATAPIHLTVNAVPETPTVTVSSPTVVVDGAGNKSVGVNEGGTVALTIKPIFESGQTEGDTTNTVTISGIKGTGATFVDVDPVSGATHSVGTLSQDGNSVTLQQADLNGLALQAPNTTETINLHVTATASEGGSSAPSAAANIAVNVAAATLQLQQLPGDEAAFNIIPTLASGATLEQVTISGFPDNILTSSTSFVLTAANGTAIPINAGGLVGVATLNFDPAFGPTVPLSTLNGLQLNLGENSPLALTVTAISTAGGSASNTFTLETIPTAETPVFTLPGTTVQVTAQSTTPTVLNVTAVSEQDPVTLDVSGLPSDATLLLDTHNASGPDTITNLVPDTNGVIHLTAAQVASLGQGTQLVLTSSFSPPDSSTTKENFSLVLDATATDGTTSASAEAKLPVQVNFNTLATINSAAAVNTSVDEGKAVGLNISVGPLGDTIVISNLGTATLNHGTVNSDGSVTLTENQLSGLTLTAGDDDTVTTINPNVVVTSPSGDSTASATFSVTVNPVPEKPTVTVSAPNASVDPTTGNVDVNENGRIALNITPNFESDSDATNRITISNLGGATLDNTLHNVPTIVNGAVTLTQAQLQGLTLIGPDTPINSFGNGETLNLAVTATSIEGAGSAVTSNAALLNVNVAPLVVQGVQTHTDDGTTKFTVTPTPSSDTDATLQSFSVIGIPVNVNNNTTPFEVLDSNGTAIPLNGFNLAPGGGTNFNLGSVTISGPELQTVLAGGLQLVELNGNSQPISLEGRVFNLRLSASSSDVGTDGNVDSFGAQSSLTLGIAETPTLTTSGVSGTQGAAIALPISARQ